MHDITVKKIIELCDAKLIIGNETFSILKVQDNWIWNKVANIILAVK